MAINSEPLRRTLIAGDLEAVFLPARGMLGASLRHRGEQVLRRVDDLQTAAAKGSTAGIPLLHPWANRLEGMRYGAAGREVQLDAASPMLHLDVHGLPMHGVPWSRLEWEPIESQRNRLSARLEWSRKDLLDIFPFPHRIELTATLCAEALTLETTLIAGPDGPVPVSFGFHPYFGIPDVPRAKWQLGLPAMHRLLLDERGIPSGAEESWDRFDSELGERSFDDGFAVLDACPSFHLTGGGRRITVELLAGYPYAQVFAPNQQEFVAIEPMTAPTNALASGHGLRVLAPRERFAAAFRVRVEAQA
ncbi:MAG TPA: aldose 1-epimerase [Steroidobacteraceae bacterium]|nr:aldose 1-epimerase [Steroidobacteraceae bacterium]